MRMTARIEPTLVIEAGCFDDECVAFPNLPIAALTFKKNGGEAR